MAKTYDVVVVGAGPAGAMTAKTAAESGLKVALLERKTDNSKIRRSDGGAIGVNHYIFGEVVKFNHKTRTFVFPVSGFSVKYDGPWSNGLFGFQLYSPGGKCFMFGDLGELRKDPEKNCQGIALSKGKLIDGIVREAEANGVEYFPNTNVTHIKTMEDGAAVTVHGADYQARFVVAADGVNSRIVRQLGLNKDRKFAGTSRDQTWMVEGAQIPDPEGLKFIITMYGIFSVSPQAAEGQFHLGTFSYDPNEDLGALIRKFTQEDPVYSPWFKNVKRMEAEEACVVNLWQPIEKPYKDRVVLVGDSCWIQEFSTAASLCAGHRLGHALTKAFYDEKFNEEGIAPYLEWYTRYCFEPRGGEELGGTGRLFDYLTAEELDYLAALPKKPAPHTLSFYKLFETIFRTYGKLVPQITQEQPGIMEKLKKMGKDRAEAQSRRIKAGFPNK